MEGQRDPGSQKRGQVRILKSFIISELRQSGQASYEKIIAPVLRVALMLGFSDHFEFDRQALKGIVLANHGNCFRSHGE